MVKHNSLQGPEHNGKSKSTMLTTREVAGIFEVHPATIRRWCSQNKIRSYRTGAGSELQFKREDVAVAYLDRSIHIYIKALSNRP